MATAAQWFAGARPRTLSAAVAPVAVGSGVAAYADTFQFGRAALALLVAVALQVGVNYANDYSDGIRGTDEQRVGPVRLVGQRLAPAGAVRAAALLTLGVGAAAGLALVALSGLWWLLLVGAASIAAAWFYTGGSRPYGYAGLGEVFVFLFFGPVAVAGTAATQQGRVTLLGVFASIPIGLWCCAILMANNLRDIPTDRQSGKHTLAVRLGDTGARRLYVGTVGAGFLALAMLAPFTWWALLPLIAAPLAVGPISAVKAGAVGPDLIPVLTGTARLLLIAGLLLALGMALPHE